MNRIQGIKKGFVSRVQGAGEKAKKENTGAFGKRTVKAMNPDTTLQNILEETASSFTSTTEGMVSDIFQKSSEDIALKALGITPEIVGNLFASAKKSYNNSMKEEQNTEIKHITIGEHSVDTKELVANIKNNFSISI